MTSFDEKEWKGRPDRSTPVNAAALNDLEARIGDAVTELDAHAADTTAVHGIADTSKVALWDAANPADTVISAVTGQPVLAASGASDVTYAPTGTIASTNVQAAVAEVASEAASALTAGLATKQDTDADLTSIAGLSPSNDDVIQRKAGAWTNRTPAQVKTDLALVKGDVGLGNVDNTSDANKPVSTAQQTALDAKIAAALVDAKGDLIVATADNTVARRAVGADGSALTADSAAADGLAYAQRNVPVPSGNYLYHPCTSAATNTQAAGAIVGGSIIVAKRQTFDRISINIGTAATGNVRLLIYADNGSGRPGALVLNAGTVDVSSTGAKEITISQSLAAGVYWLCAFAETTAGTVGWTANNGLGLLANHFDSIPGNVASRSGFFKTGNTIGSPPDPLGTVGGSTNLHPIIGLRAA